MSYVDGLSPDQLLCSAWKEGFGLSCSLLQQISIQIYSYTFSVTCCSAALLSYNLSDFFSSLLFPPASLCASLCCFWISFPSEFWFLLSVKAFYSFLFASLSTFCMSRLHSSPWCSPFLILLTQSGAVFDLTVQLRSSLAHTFSDSVGPGTSQLACVIVKLLSSSALFIHLGSLDDPFLQKNAY